MEANKDKKFAVIKLQCRYCGEVKYLIVFCGNCRENMEVAEQIFMTLDEIRQLLKTEDVELIGADQITKKIIMGEDAEDFSQERSEVSSLSEDEIDSFWGDSGFSAF